jgi:hypothetical protein
MDNSHSFSIMFRGIEYVVDVTEWKGKTTVYVEYAKINDEIEEGELLNLTQYLIEEGFVEYNDIE